MFLRIADFSELKGFLVEFLETSAPEKSKIPENRQNSGFFRALPFTMHLVCTLLFFPEKGAELLSAPKLLLN